jgi:putative ABC transport system permease protein
MAGIAPVVYIPMRYLEQTGLMKTGSRVNYTFYYKYDHKVDMEKLTKKLDPILDKNGMNYDTIETRKENTGRAFGDLGRFLSLVGFIAFAAGLCGRSQRYSYLCARKDCIHSHYALFGC